MIAGQYVAEDQSVARSLKEILVADTSRLRVSSALVLGENCGQQEKAKAENHHTKHGEGTKSTRGDKVMEIEPDEQNVFPTEHKTSCTCEENQSTRESFSLHEEEGRKSVDGLSSDGENSGHEAELNGETDTLDSLVPASNIVAEAQDCSITVEDKTKKRISFRALVRMKGLGKRIKKKHHINKAKQKPNRNDSKVNSKVNDPTINSDSSAKYLLESSCEDQTITNLDDRMSVPKRKASSNDMNIFSNLDESSSSMDTPDVISLERRRMAVCDELEKTLLCGDQTLADLRAILVVQQKLTGFGLL